MATYNYSYPPPPTSANSNAYHQQQQHQRRTSKEQTMSTMYYPPPPASANPNLYQPQQRRVSNESAGFHPPTMQAQAQAGVSYPPSPNPYPQQQRRVSNENPPLAFAYPPASPSRPGYGNYNASTPGGSPGGMPKAYSSRRKAPCNNEYAQTPTPTQATTTNQTDDYDYLGQPNPPPPPTEPQPAEANKKKKRGWFGKLNKEPGVEEGQQRILEQIQASTSSPQRNPNPSSAAVSSPAVDDDRTIAKILRKGGNKTKAASSSAIVVAPSRQSSNLPKEVHPLKLDMKNERKAKMAGAATTGAIVGAVLTGPVWPVGAVAGAALGSGVAKVTARAGERRQQRKWEQQAFNEYVAKGEAGVQSESVAFA